MIRFDGIVVIINPSIDAGVQLDIQSVCFNWFCDFVEVRPKRLVFGNHVLFCLNNELTGKHWKLVSNHPIASLVERHKTITGLHSKPDFRYDIESITFQ